MMDRTIIGERKRKVHEIVDRYEMRGYRQEDIARELGIPIGRVRRVLQDYGYEHTIDITPDNAKQGQKAVMAISYENMDYLDKYNF